MSHERLLSALVLVAANAVAAITGAAQLDAAPPYQANGVKIGEVRGNEALVWVRATRFPERNLDGPLFSLLARGPPPGKHVAEMRDAVPGYEGEMRLRYAPEGLAETVTSWVHVSSETDYTHVFRLQDLDAATRYRVVSEVRTGVDGPVTSRMVARFKTAPSAESVLPVTLALSTCQYFSTREDPDGHEIYRSMLALEPDFFVHLGDFVYYDGPGPFATTIELARYKWNRMTALPLQRRFYAQIPAYFLRDDHDTLRDDTWPGQSYGDLTFEDGLRLFREQLPVPRAGETPYRTIRWGRDLQIWLLEGRQFRSPNTMEDGPGKTILGAAQLAWLRQTLRDSEAAVKLILSATPVVGPDRARKKDNHANAGFNHEGSLLRAMFADQGAIVISGDRHWQYVSRDPETGLLEFGTGPASDRHAGGYPRHPPFDPEFLRVKGGFLSVRVQRSGHRVGVDFLHHDVGGRVVNTVHVWR